MKRTLREDGNAVSPVIGTILMVAITVVLAAVLYVIVAGFVVTNKPPRQMSVNVRETGTNWSVEVIAAPAGALPASTYLLVRDPGGAIVLTRTSWEDLTWPSHRAVYQDANPASAEIGPGDSLLLDRARYPAGSTIEVLEADGLLAQRAL
ncbi:MAG TPA: type IV pilin [Thermoplasmata archaeon]